MRSISAIALLSAFGAVVNAAPATNSVSRRQEEPKGAHVLIDKKAPFQEPSLLPPLNGASEIDLSMEGATHGYSPDTDEYKCHGSCGILNRIYYLGVPKSEICAHPWAQPHINFCFGTCNGVVPHFSGYPPSRKLMTECNLHVQEARSTTVEQVASTSAKAPASTSSSQAASTTGSPASRPTGSAAPSGSPSQAPPASSPSSFPSRTSAPHALPTGTASRPPHPSGAASASGTAPKATPTNAGPVTAGAASTSFSVIAAITVATLAMIIA